MSDEEALQNDWALWMYGSDVKLQHKNGGCLDANTKYHPERDSKTCPDPAITVRGPAHIQPCDTVDPRGSWHDNLGWKIIPTGRGTTGENVAVWIGGGYRTVSDSKRRFYWLQHPKGKDFATLGVSESEKLPGQFTPNTRLEAAMDMGKGYAMRIKQQGLQVHTTSSADRARRLLNQH